MGVLTEDKTCSSPLGYRRLLTDCQFRGQPGYQRLIFTLEGDRLEIVMIEGVGKNYED